MTFSDAAGALQRPSSTISRPYPEWRQLFPGHRMATVAKTPLLVGLGMYIGGAHFQVSTIGVTMALAALLWAALYVLNEACDLSIEKGQTVPLQVRFVLFALPGFVCLAALGVSTTLFLLLAAMTIGQLAYTVPPLRLKRYWWVAPTLSGGVNPLLRVMCGTMWAVHPVPAVAYAVVVCLHLGGAIRTRSLSRLRDRNLGYKVAPAASEKVGAACMAAGLLGANCLCFQNVLPQQLAFATVPAVGFAAYAWSGRVTNMAQLRKGWTWFAVIAVLALILLCAR